MRDSECQQALFRTTTTPKEVNLIAVSFECGSVQRLIRDTQDTRHTSVTIGARTDGGNLTRELLHERTGPWKKKL